MLRDYSRIGLVSSFVCQLGCGNGGGISLDETRPSTVVSIPLPTATASGPSAPMMPAMPMMPVRSTGFCSAVAYHSGFVELDLMVLVDRSDSMNYGGKWDQLTTALSAFVKDPGLAGFGVGLQYFPSGHTCDEAVYAKPALPIALLPGNAHSVEASLASTFPDGETPTVPAIRGAIEYARAVMLADPSRRVVVALVTDGDPNACDSTREKVVTAATEGVANDPQVLTFVIGLPGSNEESLQAFATAGGSVKPVIIGSGPTATQDIVSALAAVRDTQTSCRFGVPHVPSGTPTAADLAVRFEGGPAPQKGLVLVPDKAQCDGAAGGFFTDDDANPTVVELCPDACAAAHETATSRIEIIVGCGDGKIPDVTTMEVPTVEGSACGGSLSYSCVSVCGKTDYSTPVCVDGFYVCPTGSISTQDCGTCPSVPHDCCKPDGTRTEASCLGQSWVCPPGAAASGDPGCSPPNECSATMLCPAGSYCRTLDFGCGAGSAIGTCLPIPTTCDAGHAPVCACDGQVHGTTCDAARVGLDLTEGCPPPSAEYFSCGPLFCQRSAETCRVTDDLTASVAPKSYACVPFVDGCTADQCGCIGCAPDCGKCSSNCSPGSGGGDSQVTCDKKG